MKLKGFINKPWAELELCILLILLYEEDLGIQKIKKNSQMVYKWFVKSKPVFCCNSLFN